MRISDTILATDCFRLIFTLFSPFLPVTGGAIRLRKLLWPDLDIDRHLHLPVYMLLSDRQAALQHHRSRLLRTERESQETQRHRDVMLASTGTAVHSWPEPSRSLETTASSRWAVFSVRWAVRRMLRQPADLVLNTRDAKLNVAWALSPLGLGYALRSQPLMTEGARASYSGGLGPSAGPLGPPSESRANKIK